MPQETQSTFPPSESVRARMYWGILRQITNDGTLVLKKIKMLFDFQTCNFSSISKHLLPLTSTFGSQLGANTSQLSTATCSEVWWASCSLQWPRRVFLAGVVEVLDLTIFGLPSTPEDLGSSGANNLAPNLRLSCNYREQRVETDEERRDKRQSSGCWVYKTYSLSGHLLSNQACCFYKFCSAWTPETLQLKTANDIGTKMALAQKLGIQL